MTKIDLFKNVAIQKLHEEVYRQLEPFIPEVVDGYHEGLDYADYLAHWDAQDDLRHYGEIREEFRKQLKAGKQRKADFLRFARERWAEIDQHINLASDIDDDERF